MQTDNWRHISDVLGGLGLIDAGMERAGAANYGALRQVTDTRGGFASRGFRAAEGGDSRPKLRLVTVDGVRVDHAATDRAIC